MLVRLMYADGHIEEGNEYSFPKFKTKTDISTYFVCYIDETGRPYIQESAITPDDFLDMLFSDDFGEASNQDSGDVVRNIYLSNEEVERRINEARNECNLAINEYREKIDLKRRRIM